jgi:3-hydroxyacyl-CoA dehydrogenase / enoyl-CoA hydratase / 3-hydroxybutyryl-CoA epimerase
LELAVSAHWRIATDEPITQFSFPETRLGLIPGLSGTQRTPQLVGLKNALAMILSAEAVKPQEALEMGLIDEVVPAAELIERAEKRALALAVDRSPLDRPKHDPDEAKAKKLFAMTERSIRIKTRGHYPAQTKAVEVMAKGFFEGYEAGQKAEIDAFAELANGDVAANLIALFFQTDFARQSAASLAAKFNEGNTSRVGIVGGGMMGASIANLAAGHGMKVKIFVNPGREQETMERIDPQLRELVSATDDLRSLADSEIVLEAVAETIEAKQKVFEMVEPVVSPECTLASNTSSLALEKIGEVVKKSDRFVGVHFFHPVDRMPLVEIIALKTTARKNLARAADFVNRMDKIPAMVKNGPGFLINRLLTIYMVEVAWMCEDSIPLDWLEESAISFGLPIGPFQVLDEVGEDVAFNVVDSLEESLGPRFSPPPIMSYFREHGGKGKRYGRGIFLWDDGKKGDWSPEFTSYPKNRVVQEKAPEAERQRLAERMIFPMIDEAARCLEEKIVMKPREIDMAIVHGIGFPAFRGGLLKYADQLGLDKVVARLREIYAGSGRTVSPLLEKYVAEGRSFYSSKAGGKEDE